MSERTLAELCPNPLAASAVFRLQRHDFLDSLGMREPGNTVQVLSEPLLALVVHPRRALGIEAELKLARDLAQQLRNAGVQLRRLAKALPDAGPLPGAFDERAGGVPGRLLLRVETELGSAHAAERAPAILVLRGAERIPGAHPTKEVARRVAHGETIEVVGVEPVPPEALQRGLGQERQGAKHRLSCLRVLRDVESEAILRDEEGVDAPVPSVSLVPGTSAIQQLDERLEARLDIPCQRAAAAAPRREGRGSEQLPRAGWRRPACGRRCTGARSRARCARLGCTTRA